MKIQSVSIKNFRSLKDVRIDFDQITTFVGPNGTGKSTVLKALDWFFNGSKYGDLTSGDVYFGDTASQIEVQVTFSGLTRADRVALGKYAVDGIDSFTAWKTRLTSGEEVLSANAKSYPPFTKVRTAANATEKRAYYAGLRESEPELGLPEAKTGPKIDEALTAWEASNVDQLQNVPEVQTNFFGFNGNATMSGLFDYVLVTADLRAAEEAQDSKSSVIGRILERTIDRSAADAKIAAIVERSQREQQLVFRSTFGEQLDSINAELNKVVETYSPGRSVQVTPADIELRAPRTTFVVGIRDGLNETPVERQGHGFQRTLLISALQMLAQSNASESDGVICLAIEEPELFQHPIQAQTFAKVLRALAEDETKKIQVAYATHSSYFIEAQCFHQIRRMTRSLDPQPIVSVHSATLDQVKDRLGGTIKASSVLSQLDLTISNQLSTAVFADFALLVEGTTEMAVIYGIGDRDRPGSLEASGLSIVPVSGKMNIPLAHAILAEIGVPVFAMFDADSGAEARAIAKGKSQKDIASERSSNVSANRKLLNYFGAEASDFPAQDVYDHFAVLDDHLETLFEAEWPEWNVALASIEAKTEAQTRKNSQAYRAATVRAKGEAPEILRQIVDRAVQRR